LGLFCLRTGSGQTALAAPGIEGQPMFCRFSVKQNRLASPDGKNVGNNVGDYSPSAEELLAKFLQESEVAKGKKKKTKSNLNQKLKRK